MPLEPKQEPPYYEITDGPAPAGTLYYIARITQESTNTPTAQVQQNTIGTVVWSRINVGSYRLTLTDAFDITKTIILATLETGSNGISVRANVVAGNDAIEVTCVDDTNSNTDDNIFSISITVYPS